MYKQACVCMRVGNYAFMKRTRFTLQALSPSQHYSKPTTLSPVLTTSPEQHLGIIGLTVSIIPYLYH